MPISDGRAGLPETTQLRADLSAMRRRVRALEEVLELFIYAPKYERPGPDFMPPTYKRIWPTDEVFARGEALLARSPK